MYIEYYIIENLLINYIIISCTSILTKKYNNNKKKWICASVGTLYSIAYIFPQLDILFTLPLKIIIIGLITLFLFDYKNKKEYFRVLLVFLLVNIFISGTTFFIIYFTGISHLKISFLIICAYISCELLKYIYNDISLMRQIKESTKEIEITLLNKTCSCRALLDTGNLLKDPLSNNDIVIVKSKALRNIIPSYLYNYEYDDIDIVEIESIIDNLESDIASRVRVIPYKHGGSSKNNIMFGIKADYIEIDKTKIGNIVVGISDFDDDKYNAILNPSILS
ncbi:sigma-E processing peptidase SpoIIGA [Romboutsia sp. 1001713B170131_170501_G6]|uniref:sigma-E processing peptidase SpoIIGA n=1 Tax=Romboutsia sp. 1001713B170131_170501_G6 TaxID=2787108 RepID=UPI0018AAD9E9|nr:sigma-E processing peptidase SpoIIGA [Romboutsia sp. 1001713B170131_170501_G6]